MLLKFAVSNFGCFRSRAEIDLIASSLGDDRGRDTVAVEINGRTTHVLATAAIFGPNASGKTTLLEALVELGEAVENSHRKWDPDGPIPKSLRRPHALTKPAVTTFEVECFVNDKRYRYECSFGDHEVTSESLNQWDSQRPTEVFRRDSINGVTTGSKQKDLRALKGATRPNSLFLSSAVQNGHKPLLPLYQWFSSLKLATAKNDIGRDVYAAHRLLRPGDSARMMELLKSADFGLKDIRAEKGSLTEQQKNGIIAFRKLSGKPTDNIEDVEVVHVELVHSGGGEAFNLPIEQESAGTQGVVRLAFPLFDAIDKQELLLVDEFDRSLHPLLSESLLRTFITEHKIGSQLLFNAHDPGLLKVLRRDSIWLTEKDDANGSRLIPLSDFHPRHDLDLARGYLQGRFGGVPELPSILRVGNNVSNSKQAT